MIYTLTFNPSLDYVMSVKDFKAEIINRSVNEAFYAGGKGINVSCVLKELGVKSTVLGFIAGFTGQELQNKLIEQEIDANFIVVENGMTRINVKICSDGNRGDEKKLETEINAQGPVVSEKELSYLAEKIDGLTKEDVLIISGSVCQGVLEDVYAKIVKKCNDNNIPVIVDASRELLWNTLEYKPFLIKPNIQELGELFHHEILTREETLFYGKELKNRGARNVLISAGEDGALLLAEDGRVYEIGTPKGKVINTVGAGDSMVAGFLAGYMETNDYEKALRMGVCTGSATAFSEGLAKKDTIKKLMRHLNIEGNYYKHTKF